LDNFIRARAIDGAKLLVLPELFTIGYYGLREHNPELLKQAEPIPGPTIQAIGEAAKKYRVS